MRIKLVVVGMLLAVALAGALSSPALAGVWDSVCYDNNVDGWRLAGYISDYYYHTIHIVVDPDIGLDVAIELDACYYSLSGDLKCRKLIGPVDREGDNGVESITYHVKGFSDYSFRENLSGFLAVWVKRVAGCGFYQIQVYTR